MGERLSWDDRINAVTVKELRQSLCGNRKTLLSVLVVTLLLLVALTGLLFYGNMRESGELWSGMGLMMSVVTLVTAMVLSLLGGLGVMLRLNREAKVPDQNMANFTCLSPWQMVRGRLLAALALMAYVCSLSLPVMAVMLQMRGVELSQLMNLWLFAVVFMLLLLSLMQLLASYGSLVVSIILGIVLGGQVFLGLLMAVVMQRGYPLTSFNLLSLTLLVNMLLMTGLFLVSTVAHLSPAHANGMLWQKGYCLVMLAVLSVCLCVLAHQDSQPGKQVFSAASMSLWLTAMVAELVLFLLACLPITWRQEASLRIREHCPENLLGRLGYYLVSNIWGGSYLLAFLLLAIMSVVSLTWQWERASQLFLFLPLLNTIGYVLFYAAAIQCLRRRFPAVPMERLGFYVFGGLGVLPVLLFCFAFLLALMVDNSPLLNGEIGGSLWRIMTVTTPFGSLSQLFDEQQNPDATTWLFRLLGLGWAVLGLLMVAPTLCRQFRAFRKPTEAEWHDLLDPQKRQP